MAVDDSRTGLLVLQAYLTREGYQVVACKAPSEVLVALDTTIPDLIILDLLMPEMDGFELCRRIRERERLRRVPVIFLSVACSLEERMMGLQVGGDDFLRKPYEAEELAARVRALLRRAAVPPDGQVVGVPP
jgi:DNA-binding response OmpR family regulator